MPSPLVPRDNLPAVRPPTPPLHVCRPKDELLEKPLGRLQKSAVAPADRQQKRQQQQRAKQAAAAAVAAAAAEASAASAAGKAAAAAGAPADMASLFVGLHAGPSAEHPVLDPGAVTNEQAWRQGRLLRIGESSYRVELNPPFLDRVELHARPFVGIPLVPVVQVSQAWKVWQAGGVVGRPGAMGADQVSP